MRYLFQYIREQRVIREIEAESEAKALDVFEDMLESFDLDSFDDESDDPGEILVLEPSE